MRTRRTHLGAVLGFVVALGACGGGGGDGGNGNNPALTIAKAVPSGDAQTDTIGAPLSSPLRVEVQVDGAPADGRTVAWAVTAGGGQVNAPTSQTGLDGVATINWKLGDQSGNQTVNASLSGAGGSPVTFTATATAGNASSITKTAGDLQTALTSTDFRTALAVRVTDRAGNVKSGQTIDWTVTGGSLVLDANSSTTNALGVATMAVDAGASAGAATLVASVQGVAGVTTTFNLNVVTAARLVEVGPAIAFISARNGSANPAVDTIQAGQTVAWVANGTVHTVRADPLGSFPSSGNLALGEIYLVTFNNTGTFQYDCAVHDNAMTGRIVVQ